MVCKRRLDWTGSGDGSLMDPSEPSSFINSGNFFIVWTLYQLLKKEADSRSVPAAQARQTIGTPLWGAFLSHINLEQSVPTSRNKKNNTLSPDTRHLTLFKCISEFKSITYSKFFLYMSTRFSREKNRGGRQKKVPTLHESLQVLQNVLQIHQGISSEL